MGASERASETGRVRASEGRSVGLAARVPANAVCSALDEPSPRGERNTLELQDAA